MRLLAAILMAMVSEVLTFVFRTVPGWWRDAKYYRQCDEKLAERLRKDRARRGV